MRQRRTSYGKQVPTWASGSTYTPPLLHKLRPHVLTLPVFSLKNHDADEEVNGMFDMGAATMDLPLEEKLQFDQGDSGRSAG